VGIHSQCGRVVELLDGLDGSIGAVAAEVQAGRASGDDKEAASSYDKLFGKSPRLLAVFRPAPVRQNLASRACCLALLCPPTEPLSLRPFVRPPAALGSRIKYLIDTPETIYGCLDSRDFLDAAQRYVRAAEVHRAFAASHRHAAQRFPLLRHQWPLVKKLGTEAWDRAAEWLGAQGGATTAQLAGALAALALLRPVDGAEALKLYLAARQRYILGCLSAAAAAPDAPPDPTTLSVLLADVAGLVCTTVAQCGELFLSRPGVSPEPLLLRTAARRDLGASELLFDPGAAGAEASPEAAAWQGLQEAAGGRLASLSAAGVALECSQWLEGLAPQVGALCGALLVGCVSGGDLLEVESGVRRALQEWSYALAAAPAEGAAAAAAAAGEAAGEELRWSDACQWVAGRPAPLWALLLEAPLLARAKELAARDFGAVPSEAGAMVAAAVAEARALPPSAPGSFDPGNWRDTITLQPHTPGGADAGAAPAGKRRRSGRGAAGGERGEPEVPGREWLPHAEAVLRVIDQRLDSALGAVLDATQAGQQRPGSGGGGGAAAAAQRASPSDQGAAARAAVLEPFAQERCVEAVEAVAALLSDTLRTLPAPADGDPGFAPAAHAALLVGRVALGVADRSAPLRLLLGPPSQWRASRADAPARRGSPAAPPALPPAAAPRLDALQQRLRQVAAEAYGVWATWAARGIAGRLVAELAGDWALRADAPLRGWEESSVAGPEGGADDVRFHLPAAPSPAALAAALGACSEVDRAGGHLLEDAPLQALRWRLGGDAATALRAALDSGGALAGARAVSEKGSLQLLFDVRFLSGLLAGAAPPAAGEAPGAAAAAAAARKRALADLEADLAGRMDPIDWATYESHLFANVGRCALRTRVLLGALSRGAPARADAAAAAAAGAGPPADSNVLRMAPAGARFVYLPVNTPTVARQRSLRPGELLGGAGPLRRAGSAAADAQSQYSFASLSTGRGAARRAAAGEPADGAAGSAAAVGAAAFEALRASRIGSLLGDKAMEVSASLGEYSFSNLSAGGAGLLSSLSAFKK
jgi:hypothetical protein